MLFNLFINYLILDLFIIDILNLIDIIFINIINEKEFNELLLELI